MQEFRDLFVHVTYDQLCRELLNNLTRLAATQNVEQLYESIQSHYKVYDSLLLQQQNCKEITSEQVTQLKDRFYRHIGRIVVNEEEIVVHEGIAEVVLQRQFDLICEKKKTTPKQPGIYYIYLRQEKEGGFKERLLSAWKCLYGDTEEDIKRINALLNKKTSKLRKR